MKLFLRAQLNHLLLACLIAFPLRLGALEIIQTSPTYYASYQQALPPGISLVANPLSCYNYRVARLFPQVPIGTIFSKLNTGTGKFSVNVFGFRGWNNPNDTLAPGDGAMMFNPTRQIVTLTVSSDINSPPIPLFPSSVELSAGLSLMSMSGINFNPPPVDSYPFSVPLPPDIFGISIIGPFFNPQDGDMIWTMDSTHRRLVSHTYRSATGWDNLPVVSQTESFFIQSQQARSIETYYQVLSLPRVGWLPRTPNYSQ